MLTISFESERIFDLGCQRKQYSCRCQILRSKKSRYAVSRKVIFNLVNYLFKRNEGQSKSVCLLVVLNKKEFLVWLSTKKVLISLSNFALKKSIGMQFHEVFLNPVKNFFKWNEGYSRSVCKIVGSQTETCLILVVYEKSTHVVVKLCAQKSVGMQFQEKWFSIYSTTCSNGMRARVREYAY